MRGDPPKAKAPFVFSEKIQNGGSCGLAYRQKQHAELERSIRIRAIPSPTLRMGTDTPKKSEFTARKKVESQGTEVGGSGIALTKVPSPTKNAVVVEIDVPTTGTN